MDCRQDHCVFWARIMYPIRRYTCKDHHKDISSNPVIQLLFDYVEEACEEFGWVLSAVNKLAYEVSNSIQHIPFNHYGWITWLNSEETLLWDLYTFALVECSTATGSLIICLAPVSSCLNYTWLLSHLIFLTAVFSVVSDLDVTLDRELILAPHTHSLWLCRAWYYQLHRLCTVSRPRTSTASLPLLRLSIPLLLLESTAVVALLTSVSPLFAWTAFCALLLAYLVGYLSLTIYLPTCICSLYSTGYMHVWGSALSSEDCHSLVYSW